jgi:site-specific DNA-cytosine methylase
MIPRANIYFSGAGLMDTGLKRGGIEVQQSFEIDKQACAVARANGHISIHQDLTQKLVSEELPCDISVATCVAHYSKDKSTRVVKDRRFKHGIRPFTVREYARLQGVPDSFTFNCSDSLAYKFIGNGVSIPVGEWIGRELRRYFKKRS